MMKLLKELTHLVTFDFRHLLYSPCESGSSLLLPLAMGFLGDTILFTWNLMGVREHGKYLFLICPLSPTVFQKIGTHTITFI